VIGAWNLDAVEAAFSDAAIDVGAWTRALNVVSAETGAYGAVLLPIKGNYLPTFPISDRMDESFEAYLRGNWHQRDERNRGAPIMNRCNVVDDLDINSFDEIKRQPYYQEFLAPVKLRWFAGVKVACGDDLWCLSLQRSIEQGPFSPEEKKKLAQLSNGLSSAAAMSRAIGFAAASAALEAFELSATAVVLIDRFGRVCRTNRSAENLLGMDVKISGKKLVAADHDATRALDRALHLLVQNRPGAALAAPICLPRSGQRPLLAYFIKLSAVSVNALADCQAVIVLVDPGKRPQIPEVVLQDLFGLTTAEARLAARVAAGEKLDDIADDLGIAKETGRNQLKSIFAKAGVHRQAELVASCTATMSATTGLLNVRV
jgi:DNA-binding CsgD family transcriptional regulator